MIAAPVLVFAAAYASGRTDGGVETGYGFGWCVEVEGRSVWHGGGWNGTATYFRRDLDRDLTVILLFNRTDAPVEEAAEEIGELFEAP